jgi:hypothetical protein
MSWFLKMCDSNMHGDRIKMKENKFAAVEIISARINRE